MSEPNSQGPWISDVHAAPGLPGEAPAAVGDIPAHYWRAFSLVAFAMNRFIIDHMLRSARFFENDAESMLLYGMLAHLNVAHIMPPGTRPSDRLGADGRVPDAQLQLRPVRLRDLEQIMGRPRETIRRRLDRLVKAGRIRRVVDGYVLEVSAVDEEMRALTVDGVKRFVDAAAAVQRVLDDAQQALGDSRAAANVRGVSAAPGSGPSGGTGSSP
jgi:hypothetical protein